MMFKKKFNKFFSPIHRFTVSPFHCLTDTPIDRFTESPFHCLTDSLYHRFTDSPFHFLTVSPFNDIAIKPKKYIYKWNLKNQKGLRFNWKIVLDGITANPLISLFKNYIPNNSIT